MKEVRNTGRIAAALAMAWMCAACGAKPDEQLGIARQALGAADDHTVLILSTTVVPDPADPGGRSPEQIFAEAAGFTVEVADPVAWGAKSAADFATYRAIVLGDPNCGTDTTSLAAAEANRTIWGPAIAGNVIVLGTAPVSIELFAGRRDDASKVTDGAIRFATGQPGKTGAYVSLSCYYTFGPTAVTVLEPFNQPAAPFTVSPAGCFDPVHKVGDDPALAAITDIVIADWGCSAHEVFNVFPSSFAPVAIDVTTTGTGVLAFPDGTSGIPYIVAHGTCGNGKVELGEQCDDGNVLNGDGCSSTCASENRPPVARCQNVSVSADASCKANASIDNGSSDPDGDPLTCTQIPAGPYASGTTNVTLTCTDNKGASSSCTGAVTVLDTTRPVFTFVPPATTISVCVNSQIGQATATDNCGPVTVTKNAPAKFPLGTTVVTWTARDAAGNTRTATQNVTAILADDASCCPSGTHVVVGTGASDNLVGTDSADCILGRGGDDVIDARGGNDFVSGGAGRDTVYGGLGDDTLYGGDGDDTLDGATGANKCSGGPGANTIANCQVIAP